jgi:hypothetical protein
VGDGISPPAAARRRADSSAWKVSEHSTREGEPGSSNTTVSVLLPVKTSFLPRPMLEPLSPAGKAADLQLPDLPAPMRKGEAAGAALADPKRLRAAVLAMARVRSRR